MRFLAIFLVLLTVPTVQAETQLLISCKNSDHSVQILVGETQQSSGTLAASFLVLADLTRPNGQQTLARFKAENQTLLTETNGFRAVLNPQAFSDWTLSSELSGIRLGDLARIEMAWRSPRDHRDPVLNVTWVSGNGSSRTDEFSCSDSTDDATPGKF